jgi:hypothetical protein
MTCVSVTAAQSIFTSGARARSLPISSFVRERIGHRHADRA